jgi:apolipoprotein D and lipocalin family protein
MKKSYWGILLFISFFSYAAQAAVTTVPLVDLQKYLGKWFEVASIPQKFQKQCVANATAEYSLSDDEKIQVINSCDTEEGLRSVAEGRAKVVDKQTNTKLKVTFVKLIGWIFLFSGDYWILDLAPDYSYALVGHPKSKYAWILSRSPSLPLEVYKQAEKKLRANGYDTCQVLTSVQEHGNQSRVPLCEYVK